MKINQFFLSTAAAAALLAGCGGQDTTPAGSEAGVASGNSGFESANTAGNSGAGGGAFQEIFPGAQPGDSVLVQNNLVVYFEFDRSEIRGEFNPMLAAHGRYLASDPAITLRLEGHADERGSREYNIGLGERRAQAVRQILLLQGATASQITTVSYGEERPAVFGSDEESYSLNRRVELVYR
jgi:peptidoglycan-associated lipoprotein